MNNKEYEFIGLLRTWMPINFIIFAGLAIPFVASVIGSACYGFPVWWFVLNNADMAAAAYMFVMSFQCIAVAAAVITYYRSAKFYGVLRYLAVVLGYGFFFLCYLGFDICNDAQAAIALIFIPIYTAVCFVTFYFITMLLGFTIRHLISFHR